VIGTSMLTSIGEQAGSSGSSHAVPLVLAYTPFVDPLPLAYDWWWLSAPVLCLGLAMIYKAYRMPTLAGYWREVLVMATQIVVAMIVFSLLLFALVLGVVPRLPAE
jgi:hypothetical protein